MTLSEFLIRWLGLDAWLAPAVHLLAQWVRHVQTLLSPPPRYVQLALPL